MQRNSHPYTSRKSCWKSKTKRKSWKQQEKNDASPERELNKQLTSQQKQRRLEGSGITQRSHIQRSKNKLSAKDPISSKAIFLFPDKTFREFVASRPALLNTKGSSSGWKQVTTEFEYVRWALTVGGKNTSEGK